METKIRKPWKEEIWWLWQTDSLRTRRVRRMNCSRICLRRLLGMLSLGITNRSRGGTWSPISCISPSTIHHSDFASPFFDRASGEAGRRLLEDGPASGRAERIWRTAGRRRGTKCWSRFVRESMVWFAYSPTGWLCVQSWGRVWISVRDWSD